MKKIGLVLEGGGMRGMFTAGVLDCFLDHKVEVDEIIGVSAGACHACSFVSLQKGRAKATNIDYLNDYRYCSLYSWITTGDLFGAKFLYDTIPNVLYPFDYEVFKQSKTKLRVVVTDVTSAEAIYYPLEDMQKDTQALRASASLPLAAKMVNVNGKKYLDGGISDSIPFQELQKTCDKVIVVLTQKRGYRKKESRMTKLLEIVYRKYPKLVERMKNRHLEYNQTMELLENEEAKGNIFVIAPEEDVSIGRIEKNKEKLEELYQIGYQLCEKELDKINQFKKD